MNKPLAVYVISNNAGLAIYECNDEYVLFSDPLGKMHRRKIYTDTNRAYFKCGNLRIHLDECFRL